MDSERPLARTTASDNLDDLDRADTAHIRVMRDDCRAEERPLSHVRRMVQGHLDRLQAALVDRCRDGRAVIDEVAFTLDSS